MDELLRAGIGEKNIDLLQKQFKIEDPDGSKRLITIAPSEEENGAVNEISLFKDATMTSSMKYSLIESLLDYSVKQDTSTVSAADILMELAMKTFEEETIYMRCRIAYYACAIAYYAGMLARKPSATNTKIDISQLNICFVGNGSKILDWISDERKCTYAAIKEMFRVGMISKDVPHAVTISDCPKHEVAKGTLEQKADINQIAYDDIVIAGEKAVASDDRMLEETDKMPPRTSVKDYTQQFDELKTFLSAFKRVLSDELGLIMPINKGFFFRENSEDMMQANIINQLDSEKDQSIKPFFLLGVEQIDVLSRERNERG